MNHLKSTKYKTASIKNRQKQARKSQEQGQIRKRLRKHRGHPAGCRNNLQSTAHQTNKTNNPSDPRIGSKKPIPLRPANLQTIPKAQTIDPLLLAKTQLEELEQDSRLNTLLIRLEAGEMLTTEEQQYVDDKLDQIDTLMTELGIVLPDDDDDLLEK